MDDGFDLVGGILAMLLAVLLLLAIAGGMR